MHAQILTHACSSRDGSFRERLNDRTAEHGQVLGHTRGNQGPIAYHLPVLILPTGVDHVVFDAWEIGDSLVVHYASRHLQLGRD